jgi:hypothetical protein
VLDKLPDEHAMRAVRLETELERELSSGGAPAVLEQVPEDGDGDGDEPPSAA